MKIMLDAGHGLHTAGKRTPDDSMREFHFNSVVANYTREVLLKYENVTVDFAHDPSGKVDIALIARTNTANSKKSDVYVSIHANAYGASWNDANGIETFVHNTASAVSKNLATLIQSKLIKATSLKNRGVKSADFHVLRETNMPAVLIECGFMTIKHEAELLKSDEYRKKCAGAIAESLVEFYNLRLKGGMNVANTKDQTVSEWAKASWEKAIKNKIVDGTNPKDNVTREQLAVILDRCGLLDK